MASEAGYNQVHADEETGNPKEKEWNVILHGKFWPNGERKPTWKEQLALGVGCACVFLNFGTFVITLISFMPLAALGKVFAGLMLFVSLISVPLMVYGETELTKVDALREVVNDVREQVNALAGENDKFTESVDELQEHVV